MASISNSNGYMDGSPAVPAPQSTQKHLRDLIFNNDGKIVMAPGVYDGFSARIALDVGFECIYMVFQISIKALSTKRPNTSGLKRQEPEPALRN